MNHFFSTYRCWRFAAVCVLALTMTSLCGAQDFDVETVVSGLNNPSGIAIQPETGDVFVADSGALRVVRVRDGKIEPVIVDFPKDTYGKGPIYDIGPLGLLFLDKNTLVVGGGGNSDGEERLRLFSIPEAGAEPIKAEVSDRESKRLAAVGDVVGEGNFYGLTRGLKGIYVTCNGDDAKGWVSRATLGNGNGGQQKLGEFMRLIPTKELTGVNAPVGITMSPENHLVVGQMGAIEGQPDSLLTFYSEEGELLIKFQTGLNDITGLAYGPKHGRLFATDFRWADPNAGGVFKLVAVGTDKCRSDLIAKLRKPTALAFNDQGDLFVTLAGDVSEGAAQPDGKVVVIRKLDVAPETE